VLGGYAAGHGGIAKVQGSGSKVVTDNGVARQGGDVVGKGRDGRLRREFGVKGGP